MSPFVRGRSVRQMDRTAARSVLFITLAVFSLTFRGAPGTDAARVDLETTSAIARQGTLALPESTLLANLAEGSQGSAVVSRRLSDARLVGTSGLGGPLAMAPLVLAGTGLEMVRSQAASEPGAVVRAAAGWRNSLLSAITAQLLVLASLRLGAGRFDAWLGGLAYAFTTFAWPQARAWEGDVQVTMLLFASLLFILRIRESFDRLEDPLRLDLLAVGSTLGLALFTSVTSLPAVIVLGAAVEVVLWRGMRRLNATRWQPKDHERARPGVVAGLVLVPLLLGVVATLVHDSLVWGKAMSFPALRPTGSDLEASLGGLLFSPGRGLFVLAPGLLLVPVGWRALARGGELLYRRTVLGLLFALLLVPVFLDPGTADSPTDHASCYPCSPSPGSLPFVRHRGSVRCHGGDVLRSCSSPWVCSTSYRLSGWTRPHTTSWPSPPTRMEQRAWSPSSGTSPTPHPGPTGGSCGTASLRTTSSSPYGRSSSRTGRRSSRPPKGRLLSPTWPPWTCSGRSPYWGGCWSSGAWPPCSGADGSDSGP